MGREGREVGGGGGGGRWVLGRGGHLLIVFETTFITAPGNFEIANALFPVNLAAAMTRFATDFHLVPGDKLQLPRQCLRRFRHGSSVIPASVFRGRTEAQ